MQRHGTFCPTRSEGSHYQTRTRATKRSSQGIVLWRNIQDKAASAEVPRRARAKRAQHNLASDESSFVTGSELVIDGGSTAQ